VKQEAGSWTFKAATDEQWVPSTATSGGMHHHHSVAIIHLIE